VLKIN